MEKTNLTNYNDDELSLQVFNNEYLYNQRYNVDDLITLLDDYFIYTEDQKDVLIEDIEEDLKEEV